MTISSTQLPDTRSAATAWTTLVIDAPGTREETDHLLIEHLWPAAESAIASGRATGWFYIRYSEGGEHLRWRLQGLAAGDARALSAQVHAATGVLPRAGSYEPEPDRYGGPAHLAGAEAVFGESTRVALRMIGGLRTPADRLGCAIGIVLETARGLGLGPADTVAWLRSNAYTWRWHLPAGHRPAAAGVLTSALRAGRTRADPIRARLAATEPTPWGEIVARASRAHRELPDRYRLAIWASHAHMMLNRLGVGPDEERWVEWFIASALETPHEPAPWFTDGLDDPDRSYLAASRYVPELMPNQAPGDDPPTRPTPPWNPFSHNRTPLPAAPMPPVSLTDALARRVSRRGPYGPVGAAQLGRLLWGASSADGAGLIGRTYPSAGAQYAARLRLLALAVDGIRPGLYEANIEDHTLSRLAPPPEADDLASMSMWLRNGSPGPSQIDVTAVPSLIAVYLDLRRIRARYGLRALRMALLEAGHLTQNLALVAAATDLQLCPVGGLYDDYAHDVLLLDGVDEVLAYLLPVGGPAPEAVSAAEASPDAASPATQPGGTQPTATHQ